MKRSIVVTLMGLLFACVCAQAQEDSLAFVAGNWTETTVAPGVTLSQCHFTEKSLFGANEFISVLTAGPRRKLAVVESPKEALEKTK